MKKKSRWLSWSLVITGAIIAFVLILAVNSEPLVRWFQVGSAGTGPESESKEGGTGLPAWHNALGAALISVFILALVASHFGLLIVAANALNKPRTHAIREPSACPRCEHSVHRDWRICPYCGWVLKESAAQSSVSRGSVPRV